MFEKRRCQNCGKNVKQDYNYCPYCGDELAGERSEGGLGEFGIFNDIDKEFERVDKMFGSNLFKVRSIPVRGGGISITINSAKGRPKVNVKTFGDYKRVEPQIRQRLKVAPGEDGESYEEEEPVSRKPLRIPKTTEEPEAKVEKSGDKQVVTIKLPGVCEEKDIEIKRLEQSLEVKAFAGTKAYFKLIPVGQNSTITKKFKSGVLMLEIGR
jgi:HSP20 family molecular chaperone IbpA